MSVLDWLLIPRRRQLLAMIGGIIVVAICIALVLWELTHIVGCMPRPNF